MPYWHTAKENAPPNTYGNQPIQISMVSTQRKLIIDSLINNLKLSRPVISISLCEYGNNFVGGRYYFTILYRL